MTDDTTSSQTRHAEDINSPHHPLYFHPEDHPGMILISRKLTGSDDYSHWKRSMMIALSARNKIKLVTGDFEEEPDVSSPIRSYWERANDMVISWILNTVSEQISNNLNFVHSAHSLWHQLHDHYSQPDGHRIYQLTNEIVHLKQLNSSIEVYYHKLKGLLDELDALEAPYNCTCKCVCENGKTDQRKRLIQFLMGLDESYTNLRGQILLLHPLPIVAKAYSMLRHEEKQLQTRDPPTLIHLIQINPERAVNITVANEDTRVEMSLPPDYYSVTARMDQLQNQLNQVILMMQNNNGETSTSGGACNFMAGSQDAQIKRPEEQSNSLWGNYRQDSLKTPVTAGLSLGSGFQSTTAVTKDATTDSRDDTAENSRSRFSFTLKSDGGVVNDPKFSQQSQSVPEPSSNTARPLVRSKIQNKQIDFSQSGNKDVESSPIWSRKTPEAPFSVVSSASASTAFSGKSFSLEASTRTSQVGEAVSSSVAPLPVPVTIAPSSSLLKDATSSSTSLGKSSTESVVVPATSAPSSFSFKDSASSSASAPSTTSSIKPSVNIELNASKSEPNNLNPVAVESSKPNVVSAPKFDLKLNENSSGQASLPQPVVSSAPSVPTSQPSTISFSGSQLNLSATTSPALISNSKPEQQSVSPAVSSPTISNPVVGVGGETNSSDQVVTQEDDMEEEAPDTAQLTLGNLGGFGLGSTPNSSAPKQNPFGAPFGNPPANTPITSFAASPPSGGLFKPASFSIESQQPSQPQQQTNFSAFTGGFASNNNQSAGGQGFGQPAKIGSGQQALGSVLGSFGQSRQFGSGLPGSFASPSPFGSGFASNQSGGFATASSVGGGFANLASGGGGFSSLATSGGGFAGAATGGGGFGAPATAGGGFGAPATSGSGFGAPATSGGGFGAPATSGGGFGAPATGGGGFGAPATSGGGFGAPATSGRGFGAPATGGGGFGAPATSGGGFGAPATSGRGFGAPATGGGGFGAPVTGCGGFGAPATGCGGFGAPATGGGGFGAPVTGGGGFGAPATGCGGFGAPATGGGGFAAPAMGGGGFGAPGGGGGFGVAATGGGGFAGAPAAGVGFGGAPAVGGFGGFSSQGGSGFSR